MALKENYKDDILDVSQNVKRKYQMENNGDGTVSFTDVTEYTQRGDSFGASDMNATNGKVNTLESDIGEINDNLTDKVNKLSGVTGYQTVDFIGYDATNKKLGLKVGGADTVIPFKGGGSKVYYLGTGKSFNIAQKLPNDYKNLTANNFIVITNSSTNGNNGWRWDSESADGNWLWFTQPSKSYNPTTGLLTIGNNTIKSRVSKSWSSNVHDNTMTCISAVYVVVGDIETI